MSPEEKRKYQIATANSEQISIFGKVYGYCRISTPSQSIERQIRNILSKYPDAFIVKESYTGKVMSRPEWSKLYKRVCCGDTIVFDSVSRMSRDAEEGIKTYFELYDRGVRLVFLKEPLINTEVYEEHLKDKLELRGIDEDEIFKGLNNYFRKLAARQIRIAFDQAEKEVQDLHQRTREGLITARLQGKQIGQRKGSVLNVKKKAPAKEIIKKHCKDFGGSLTNKQCMMLANVSKATYYKYKRELLEEINKQC